MDIKDTIAELTAERDRIDTALEALREINGSAAPALQPTAPKPAQRRTRRSNGAGGAGKLPLTPENVLSLTTSYGVPASVVRAGVKASDNQVLAMLKRLEKTGRVTRTGNRRSTRWHSVVGSPAAFAQASHASSPRAMQKLK
jgi:hypothetical protein